jgi:hypothetical protein
MIDIGNVHNSVGNQYLYGQSVLYRQTDDDDEYKPFWPQSCGRLLRQARRIQHLSTAPQHLSTVTQ